MYTVTLLSGEKVTYTKGQFNYKMKQKNSGSDSITKEVEYILLLIQRDYILNKSNTELIDRIEKKISEIIKEVYTRSQYIRFTANSKETYKGNNFKRDNICPKCLGLGVIRVYSHVDNGICHRCKGNGTY